MNKKIKIIITISILLISILIIGVLFFTNGSNTTTKIVDNEVSYKTVKVYDLSKITVTKTNYEISDKLIQDKINSVLASNATKTKVEDGIINENSYVTISVIGTIDGKTEEELTFEKDINIGTDDIAIGLNNKLIGMKVNESSKFDITITGDSFSNSVKNKTVNLEISIKAIYTITMPTITDDLIFQYTGYKTIDSYKSYLKDSLITYYQNLTKTNLQNSVLKSLVENSEIPKVSKNKIDEFVKKLDDQYNSYAKAYGITLDELLSKSNLTMEDYTNEKNTSALFSAKKDLIFEKLSNTYNIDFTDEDLNNYYQELVDTYYFDSITTLKASLNEDDIASIKSDAKNQKIMDFILSKANITEKTKQATLSEIIQ